MRTNLKPAPIKTKTNLDQPKDQPWTNLLRLVSGARPTSRPFRVKTLLLNTILSLFILKVGLGWSGWSYPCGSRSIEWTNLGPTSLVFLRGWSTTEQEQGR